MKRTLMMAAVAAGLLLTAAPAWAIEIGDPVAPQSLLGGVQYFSYLPGDGYYLRMGATTVNHTEAGKPGVGRFGAEWAGPVNLTSLSFTKDGSRDPRVKEVWIYTSPTATPIVQTFADVPASSPFTYTVNFGTPLLSSYVMVVVKSIYGSSHCCPKS